VITEDEIPVSQMTCNCHSGKFLPNAGVYRAKQLTFRKQLKKALLEGTHQKGTRIRIKRDFRFLRLLDRA
jgi:hypothetical protein